MRMRNIARVSVTALLAVSLAACSTKGVGPESSKGEDGVEQGVGVTEDTITLGVMSDLSGPLKPQGLAATAGNELWAAEANAAGGVCGRDIKLEIVDHGYAADTAVASYPSLAAKSLGLIQLLGSQISAALKTSIDEDAITATAASFSSEVLSDPNILIMGTTYDLEMINVLDYASKDLGLSKGDKIGHIYLEGELGANALRGLEYFADQNGLEVVAEKVSATDTDMSGVVQKLRSAGISLLALTVTPGATAAVLSSAKSLGLDVPMVTSNPAFDPVLFDSPAAGSVDGLLIGHSLAPIGSDVDAAKKVLAAYKEKYDATPSISVIHGYATGLIWGQLLESACEAGSLTREGIQEAVRRAADLSTEGLSGQLDFTKAGVPTSRESFILRPDSSIDGGLAIVEEGYESDEAASYRAPHES